MASFGDKLRQFANQSIENATTVVKTVGIDMLASVVNRSPVGNPELWQVNKIATEYNALVADWNAQLRADPANLGKSGRLKPGRLLKDGMDIVAPAGYAGGRFRANWQVTLDAPPSASLNEIDDVGAKTIANGTAVVAGFTSDNKAIYLVNNLAYAKPLEYGHSTQAPGGMVRVTVSEFGGYVEKAVNEVKK